MLDVTRLRVLVAVARCGSVTAAARALNYAQPSVSHHLARLEAETGTKLIQRAGRGIRLTDAGRLLAERAAEVIGRLDAAENELAAYTGLRAGRLRLAAFPSALGTIVPAAAALLREQQPGVDLRLTEAEPPEALRGAIERTPGIAAVTPPVVSQDGQATMMVAYPATGEQDTATNALVDRLRNDVLPKDAYLTGPNAGNVTFANLIGSRLPPLIGVVVALSMALLLVVFRSVVIAVKAAVMNLLSVCAAYGVLVAVTQWGWLGHALGFPEKMPVTTWVPVFLFVILFGLSMDYEVFLLSKIREEYDRCGDNALAVRRGLAATARVISAAAAIMVVVFLSFVLTPDVSVKQIGLGLAAAVLVDATVVRLVLVPAVMELLGTANWWLPGWLARRLPGRPAQVSEPARVPAEVH